MKIDIKGILSGLYNKVVSNKQVEAIAAYRDEICRKCIFNTDVAQEEELQIDDTSEIMSNIGRVCTKCHCFLDVKQYYMAGSCPVGKWGPVCSPEESDQIEDYLNKKEDGEV